MGKGQLFCILACLFFLSSCTRKTVDFYIDPYMVYFLEEETSNPFLRLKIYSFFNGIDLNIKEIDSDKLKEELEEFLDKDNERILSPELSFSFLKGGENRSKDLYMSLNKEEFFSTLQESSYIKFIYDDAARSLGLRLFNDYSEKGIKPYVFCLDWQIPFLFDPLLAGWGDKDRHILIEGFKPVKKGEKETFFKDLSDIFEEDHTSFVALLDESLVFLALNSFDLRTKEVYFIFKGPLLDLEFKNDIAYLHPDLFKFCKKAIYMKKYTTSEKVGRVNIDFIEP